MNTIRSYMMSVTAASFLFGVISALLPKGKIKHILCFAGTLVMILTVLSPIIVLDASDIAQTIAELRIKTEEWESGVQLRNQELQSKIIKERSESYVLDRAEAMGVEISVNISLQDDKGYPYPYRISILGSVTADEREMLSAIISENLGIPVQQQEWDVE